MQSEITLYRNSQYPLDGAVSGAAWAWPGTALTANTSQWYGPRNIVSARWVVAWNPNTGPSPTGIALVLADSGPSNVQQIASFLIANTTSPRVDAVDVTAHLAAIMGQKTIGHQTAGNGQNGCKIYGSWIECVWS